MQCIESPFERDVERDLSRHLCVSVIESFRLQDDESRCETSIRLDESKVKQDKKYSQDEIFRLIDSLDETGVLEALQKVVSAAMENRLGIKEEAFVACLEKVVKDIIEFETSGEMEV